MECKIYSSLDLYDDFVLIVFKEFFIPKCLYLGGTRLIKPISNRAMIPYILIKVNIYHLIKDSFSLANYTISNPSICFGCDTVDLHLNFLKDFEFRVIMDYPTEKVPELLDYVKSVYDSFKDVMDFSWWYYFFNEWKKSLGYENIIIS